MSDRHFSHHGNQMGYQQMQTNSNQYAFFDERELPRLQADLIQTFGYANEIPTANDVNVISIIGYTYDPKTLIMEGCNQLPRVFQHDFRDKIATGFIACIDACRTLLLQQNYLTIFTGALMDINRDEPTWSKAQQIAYASKEALKSIFTNAGNAVMKECAKHLGMEFVKFAQSAFMSELTGFLIEYLVDQIYACLGGAGGGGNSFDFATWLEELILFLLRFFIVLMFCQIHPEMILLKSFLDIIVPKFLNYLNDKLRSKRQ